MFNRPQPADLLRTLEDTSGIDLDWFWRGWFYTTDYVDIAVEGFRRFDLNTMDSVINKARARRERKESTQSISEIKDSPADWTAILSWRIFTTTSMIPK